MGLIVAIILPLWLLHLGASFFEVGIAAGARHFISMFLSIHGGALMDRLGTRRIMLWFALVSTFIPILFPILPFVLAVIILQMIAGLADGMGWSGAQTMIGRTMKGNPTYAGRLSFSLRIGHLSGPPLVGAAWDFLGPWGAFGLMSLWAGGGLISAWMLPANTDDGAKIRITARDLLPRWSEYVETFKLLTIPAVLFVIMVTMVRHSGTGMQNSFYVVYLEGIDLTGTLIGFLFTAAAVVGAFCALSVGWLSKIITPAYLLTGTVIGTVCLMAITPLLSAYILLMVVNALRGGVLGISQPLMISILGRSLPVDTQGKGVGLRTTSNRIMNTFLPPAAGALADAVGLEIAFYIIGVIGVGLILIIHTYALRNNGFGNNGSV